MRGLKFIRTRFGSFLGSLISGTGDSQRIDSRESFAIDTPIFIARQADSPESLEFPIRAKHATKLGSLFAVFKPFFVSI